MGEMPGGSKELTGTSALSVSKRNYAGLRWAEVVFGDVMGEQALGACGSLLSCGDAFRFSRSSRMAAGLCTEFVGSLKLS